MTVEIILPDGGPADGVYSTLVELAGVLTTGWVLVGGQMVALLALESGRPPARVTADVDMVVDVRLPGGLLGQTIGTLIECGYVSAGVSAGETSHRFVRGGVAVDVLAPDGLGPRSDVRTVGAATTIQVSGGMFALRQRRPVPVRWKDTTAVVQLPDMAGALVVKAGAAVTDTSRGPERHVGDLAYLASLIDDPYAVAGRLGTKNQSRLRKVRRLSDPDDQAWRMLGAAAADGYAAWAIVADL